MYHKIAHCVPLLLLLKAALLAQSVLSSPLQVHREQFVAGGAIVRIAANGDALVSRDNSNSFAALPATDPLLYLRFGTFDPMQHVPRLPSRLGVPLDSRLFLVQSKTAIVPEYRVALLATGLEVIAYIPAQAYLVRGDKRQCTVARALPWVRWFGDFPVAYKLEPELLDLAATNWQPSAPPIECNLVLAQLGDRAALIQRIVQLSGEVTQQNEGSTFLQARVRPMQLASISADSAVLFVDRTTPIGVDMNNVREVGGANRIEALGGFTGAGVRVEITEGLDNLHPDWSLAPQIRFDGLEAHGHCTAAIVGSNGNGSPNTRGVLPDSQLIESSVFNWLFGGVSRWSLISGSVDPAQPFQVMQQTASWGNTHTLAYTSVSQELDDALFKFDLLATQSMGNTAAQSARPQAWAKNVISVGSVSHFNNQNSLDDAWVDGSIGPASDGRIKPDICGFGDAIFCGDVVGAGGYATGNYVSGFGGTSAATPIVNGYLGLVQQMFTDGLFHNPLAFAATAANRFVNRPHLSTAKALLLNTTQSYPFFGEAHNLARTHQGWGFPDVARLYSERNHTLVVDEYLTLRQGEQHAWTIWVRPATPELRVTMIYSDPAAVPNAAVARVNDLDLRVTNVDGSQSFYGNHGLSGGNASLVGGVPDARNNVEQVWIPSPPPGIYKIYVSAPTIVQDGHLETSELDADFALVAQPLGGGFHGRERMQLDMLAEAPGDLRVKLANVPATGWTQGFTLLSFDTYSQLGFGSFFGLQADMLTAQICRLPAMPGDLFHFTNAGPASFPFQPFVFPPSMVNALSGIAVDGMVTLLGADWMIAEQSNCARVRLK